MGDALRRLRAVVCSEATLVYVVLVVVEIVGIVISTHHPTPRGESPSAAKNVGNIMLFMLIGATMLWTAHLLIQLAVPAWRQRVNERLDAVEHAVDRLQAAASPTARATQPGPGRHP